MSRVVFSCLFTVAVFSLIGGSLSAAEEANFAGGAERILGGHAFMHSEYIPNPFIGTAFTNHVGAASALNYKRDFRDLDGNLLFTLEGSVVFASLGMKLQQRLGDKWAVGLGGSGLVRSGTNALSFIDDGANVNTNLEAWAKRLLRRGENSQLTGGLSWRYSTVTLFTPREFAQHLIDGGSLDTAPFVVTGKTWDLQADVLWAYAFNATYGLRASGSFGVVEKFGDDSEMLGKNRVGVMGEVDFKDRHGLPLGITLGYFRGFPVNLSGAGTSGSLLGFWYTGKREFIVGLETGLLEIPTDDKGGTIDGAFGTFNIKYYF